MGELGIDAWGLAVQIVAFLIFIYLFWRYALGPITNMLDERSRRISESMAAADAMKAEMARPASATRRSWPRRGSRRSRSSARRGRSLRPPSPGRRRKPASRPRSTSRARRQLCVRRRNRLASSCARSWPTWRSWPRDGSCEKSSIPPPSRASSKRPWPKRPDRTEVGQSGVGKPESHSPTNRLTD